MAVEPLVLGRLLPRSLANGKGLLRLVTRRSGVELSSTFPPSSLSLGWRSPPRLKLVRGELGTD